MNKNLLRTLKTASLDPSQEALEELCASLLRFGYNPQKISKETVVYALIINEYGRELGRGGGWNPPGRGHRYKQLSDAFYRAKMNTGQGNQCTVKIIRDEHSILAECEVGDEAQEDQ